VSGGLDRGLGSGSGVPAAERDRVLLAAVAGGDEAGLRGLVDRHGSGLLAYLTGLAEDGVGEMDASEQARQQREGGDVEVGPLAPPALDDPVHVIGHHLGSIHRQVSS
jgi:hypothetical protein